MPFDLALTQEFRDVVTALVSGITAVLVIGSVVLVTSIGMKE